MKEHKFEIGDWVYVAHAVEFYYDDDKVRRPHKTHIGEFGQIIGATYRQTGIYNPGSTGRSSYSLDPPEYEQAYLSVDHTFLVWKILLGYVNKPIEALEADIRKHDLESPILPWRYSKNLNRFYLEKANA